MAPASVTLGRPWHPYGDPEAIGSAVFIDTWMDDHIGARGWDRMSMVDSTGSRTWWEPATARFYEYRTRGPGAVASESRRVLSPDEAAKHTPQAYMRGWMPQLPIRKD